MTLLDLTVSKLAYIDSVTGPCANRWQSMGIVPGQQIVLLRHGPGKISHCRIGTAEFAIDSTAAQAIFIKNK